MPRNSRSDKRAAAHLDNMDTVTQVIDLVKGYLNSRPNFTKEFLAGEIVSMVEGTWEGGIYNAEPSTADNIGYTTMSASKPAMFGNANLPLKLKDLWSVIFFEARHVDSTPDGHNKLIDLIKYLAARDGPPPDPENEYDEDNIEEKKPRMWGSLVDLDKTVKAQWIPLRKTIMNPSLGTNDTGYKEWTSQNTFAAHRLSLHAELDISVSPTKAISALSALSAELVPISPHASIRAAALLNAALVWIEHAGPAMPSAIGSEWEALPNRMRWEQHFWGISWMFWDEDLAKRALHTVNTMATIRRHMTRCAKLRRPMPLTGLGDRAFPSVIDNGGWGFSPIGKPD